MTRILDQVYRAAGVLAAVFLVAIALFVLAQVLGRLAGQAVPSADEFAGYCLSASSFLALAYTLRSNAHIRVTLFLRRFPPRIRHGFEIWCLLLTTALIGYFAFFAVRMVWESYQFGERTMGLVPIMLWIPQTGMALGVVLLATAFLEELIRVLAGHPPRYQVAEREAAAASDVKGL